MQKQGTPPFGGVPSLLCQTLAGGYIASEPPSPSGQGPLPLAVVETPTLCNTGTVHFTILLLDAEKIICSTIRPGLTHPKRPA